MSRLPDVEALGERIGEAVLTRSGRAAARIQERGPLPVDLLATDEEYLAVFDAPGATASDVQVRYLDGEVLVRIDRFREFREGHEMRFPGRGLSLDGAVSLPADAVVAADAASATLSDRGTLEVRLPRIETAEVDVETPSEDAEAETGADESVDAADSAADSTDATDAEDAGD